MLGVFLSKVYSPMTLCKTEWWVTKKKNFINKKTESKIHVKTSDLIIHTLKRGVGGEDNQRINIWHLYAEIKFQIKQLAVFTLH